MKSCRFCGNGGIAEWLDLGPQPLSNRFLRAADEPEYTHPLAIGCCRACGVVQLETPAPAEEVRPRFDWLSYNEPESHLDALADDIRRLPGLTPQSTLCGITSMDESTLRRLHERGLPNTRVANRRDDLDVAEPCAGLETIQQRLTPEAAERMVARHGRPDVVIVRRLLEHAHDLPGMLAALHRLVAPAGYVVVEVPDARRALDRCDYSTVWEEHAFYFTPLTLKLCFAMMGFEVVCFRTFSYTLEDSLVAIVRPADRSGARTVPDLGDEVRRAERFVTEFAGRRERYRRFFTDYRRDRGKIAFLGAGHLTCAMINYFGLAPLVEFVADDHPKKQGLYMPGSRLPIRGTGELAASGVTLCCMGIRPEIEARVVENHRPFRDAGGHMASIFPGSPFALAV